MGVLFKAVIDKAQTFDEVMKFNPYHDAKGRFTNSGGAMSFTYAPGKSKAHDMAIAREKERAAAEAAKNASGVKITEAENKIKGILPEKAVVNLKGVDPEIAGEVHDSIKQVLDKYPSVKEAFGGFTTDDTDDHLFANKENVMGCFDPATKMIHLNPAYYGDKEAFDRKYAESVEKQYHSVGTDYKSVVVHEMGHAIDHYVTRRIDGPWGTMGGDTTTATKIWNADIKKMQKKSEDGKVTGKMIRENLSGYASKRPAEYLAEGFAEFMCSPNPRPTAKSIGKRITNAIDKAAKE